MSLLPKPKQSKGKKEITIKLEKVLILREYQDNNVLWVETQHKILQHKQSLYAAQEWKSFILGNHWITCPTLDNFIYS